MLNEGPSYQSFVKYLEGEKEVKILIFDRNSSYFSRNLIKIQNTYSDFNFTIIQQTEEILYETKNIKQFFEKRNLIESELVM